MDSNLSKIEAYIPVAELFSSLASPIRSAIVHRLSVSPATVSEIVADVGQSQPLVSHHLRLLKDGRIVTANRRGREVVYSLADDHVAHIFLDALTHTKE